MQGSIYVKVEFHQHASRNFEAKSIVWRIFSALSASFFVSFVTFSRRFPPCETLDPGIASSKVKSGEVKGKKKAQSTQGPMLDR